MLLTLLRIEKRVQEQESNEFLQAVLAPEALWEAAMQGLFLLCGQIPPLINRAQEESNAVCFTFFL